MKNGNVSLTPLFIRRRFWPQFFWILIMFVFGGLGCVFDSASLFVVSILAAFLGLTESSRWTYKTNLLICTAGTVAGLVCGVFTWFETGSVFVLLFVVGGFILYYRDSEQKFIARMEEFAFEIAKERSLEDIIRSATEKIREMTTGDEVFIVIADKCGGLYMPESIGRKKSELSRNGGAVWKVFASGRPYITGRVEPSKDLPLCRDACSVMSVVLSARGEKIGVIEMESSTPEAFSENDLHRLGLIAFLFSQPLYELIKKEKQSVDNSDKKEENAVI